MCSQKSSDPRFITSQVPCDLGKGGFPEEIGMLNNKYQLYTLRQVFSSMFRISKKSLKDHDNDCRITVFSFEQCWIKIDFALNVDIYYFSAEST